MRELTPLNAADWAANLPRNTGLPPEPSRSEELGGGVSNKVILTEGPHGRAVLKQSLGKLRVEQEWLSDRDRIFREAEIMRWLNDPSRSSSLQGGRVPRLLAEDRADYIIAMEAAPRSAEMWKTRLFRGELDPAAARAAGTMLGSIIAASWHHPEAESLFGDQTVFDQLRIDPYYRAAARRNPDTADWFDALIARSAARRVSLVHGDWSPKNLLIDITGELWVIDWEVIHFGDPAYDVAFLLNHLLLKSIALPQYRDGLRRLAVEFLRALETALPPDARWIGTAAFEHLPALLLARVDGKSPAEYLDAAMATTARRRALSMIRNPMTDITEAFEA